MSARLVDQNQWAHSNTRDALSLFLDITNGRARLILRNTHGLNYILWKKLGVVLYVTSGGAKPSLYPIYDQ
jgi:hypothetical protein